MDTPVKAPIRRPAPRLPTSSALGPSPAEAGSGPAAPIAAPAASISAVIPRRRPPPLPEGGTKSFIKADPGDPEPDEASLKLPSGWTCEKHGTGAHDVFLSYRVWCEGAGAGGNHLVGKLAAALQVPFEPPLHDGGPLRSVSVFWDQHCLNDGESWETALHNGLEGASLVVPLVSAKALQGMVSGASHKRDNLLMEWEIALERHRAGLCLILPVFVCEGGKPFNFDDSESAYPSSPHFLSRVDIRATILAVLRLNGVSVDPTSGSDIAAAVGRVASMLRSKERRVLRMRQVESFSLERTRAERMWARVSAIVAKNDIIGRGASSIVYRGQIVQDDPDEPVVAVKAMLPSKLLARCGRGLRVVPVCASPISCAADEHFLGPASDHQSARSLPFAPALLRAAAPTSSSATSWRSSSSCSTPTCWSVPLPHAPARISRVCLSS